MPKGIREAYAKNKPMTGAQKKHVAVVMSGPHRDITHMNKMTKGGVKYA